MVFVLYNEITLTQIVMAHILLDYTAFFYKWTEFLLVWVINVLVCLSLLFAQRGVHIEFLM